MIIEYPKLSFSRIQRTCSRKKLTKYLLLEREGEEILRYSEDSRNSWNGGDYTEWIEFFQYWAVEKSSCDMEGGEMQAGGFLFGTPVIVTFPHYTGDICIFFPDESKMYISTSEWDQIDQWERICLSDWGLHFNYK